ncbi:MAG: WecB/TagA/CpsF family glycosyltransferase [Candidatus Gracilibacteria bacterium]
MFSHTFFGIDFIKSSYEDCLREIQIRLVEGQKTLIVTPNPEMLYAASQDAELQKILESSDMALPDGVGIFVGYQIRASRLPKWMKYMMLPYWCLRAIMQTEKFRKYYGERITGSKITPDILSYAAQNSIGISIIDPPVTGNSPGDTLKKESQKTMKDILQKKYPGLMCDIILADSGGKGDYWPIVLTTHGNGTQEKIVTQILAENSEVLLGIGVGSSIDLLTGFRIPAPIFFRRFGGEWLYRLYKNPRKHIKRIGNVWQFLKICLGEN